MLGARAGALLVPKLSSGISPKWVRVMEAKLHGMKKVVAVLKWK